MGVASEPKQAVEYPRRISILCLVLEGVGILVALTVQRAGDKETGWGGSQASYVWIGIKDLASLGSVTHELSERTSLFLAHDRWGGRGRGRRK